MTSNANERNINTSGNSQKFNSNNPITRFPKHHLLSGVRNLGNHLTSSSTASLFSLSSSSSISSHRIQEMDHETENNDFAIWESEFGKNNLLTPRAHKETQNHYDATYGRHMIHKNNTMDASTPTPTRPTTPHPSSRFSEVKHFINGAFTRSQKPCLTYSNGPAMHLQDSSDSRSYVSSSLNTSYIYHQRTNSASGSETPPLTPDTATNDDAFSSPISFGGYEEFLHDYYYSAPEEEDDEHYIKRHSLEIKEGKKPEHPIYYDTLMEDLPAETVLADHTELRLGSPAIFDDKDEWYGLEYILELSARECHFSDMQSPSIGEHSKSRESWALLRQGRINPYFEDEDYYQWKNWHRYLDREEQRRKHWKGLQFKAHAKNLALCFMDEIRIREIMYWQKDVYGGISKDVKDRLAYIAHYRPDPYYPSKKHNLGWLLKRSRSVGCLRELVVSPDLTYSPVPLVETPEEGNIRTAMPKSN